MKGLETRVLWVMYSGTLKFHRASGILEKLSWWLPGGGGMDEDGEEAIGR